ncbi:D-lactate dehydrogenase [Nitzschia inconspicua]|uniref:D-lactate dehydrogenase (cytochrome) n=1 Tax=Nitzschia inconspicua TaxID=303405 RepID=A0A9K3L078_9STRA|nr:D-lactate dehydrogenase [Nitzschia inconspicua]
MFRTRAGKNMLCRASNVIQIRSRIRWQPWSNTARILSTNTNRQDLILSSLEGHLSPSTDFSVNPYELERHGRGESYHPTRKPDIIISPSTVDDVSAILRFANKHLIPVIPFGAGTSVEGHICALEGGISLDMAKFQDILLPGEAKQTDSDNFGFDESSSAMLPDPIATVGAGVTRKTLNVALRHTGLQFVVDPGADATIGGMTATGASGTTAVRYGTMRENLLQVECVLPDGTIAKTGTKALKSSAGYDLVSLLCGSEGTLGVITSVTVKLHPVPEHVLAAVCVFDTLADAANTVVTLKLCEIPLVRCELLDATSVAAFNSMIANDDSNTIPEMEVKPTLFLEFQASSENSLQEQVRMTETITKDFGGSNFQFTSEEEDRKILWAARHNLYYASINLRKGATDAVLTDACVPLSKFAELIEATVRDVEEKGVVGPCFGHAGDGNFHCILPIAESDSEDYIAKVHEVNDNLIQRTLACGGTCTGEHGVGYGKIKYLEQQYGPGAVRMMETIKKSLDPNGIMNPGKIVRYGTASSSTRLRSQRRTFSTESNTQLARRCHLLDATRGHADHSFKEKEPLPAFPLELRHFGDHLLLSNRNFNTPGDFHKTLCNLIRNSQERILLASLYIGPAASPSTQQEEVKLLNVLSDAAKQKPDIPIKVVLDHNRALRSVPVANSDETTSSVKAVAEAIKRNVYLLQVLPSPLDTLLPNPLNEVGGVFHIKVYIVDNHLLLSGANLSQEYFCDRQDRYLWIREGGNGLVDFYAHLVELLCKRSHIYNLEDPDQEIISSPEITKDKFLQELTQHFREASALSAEQMLTNEGTVAVGIPTFFAPPSFFGDSELRFVSDKEATLSLLEEGAKHPNTLQLSSAYLNPTSDMMSVLKKFKKTQLLTAGRVSHGFRPKKKAGNKGKEWIPAVFDHLAQDVLQALSPSTKLFHWERENWTFHAKGIWLREGNEDGKPGGYPVAAAIVGSSNFGERSWVRDMESNLVLIFPPDRDGTSEKGSQAIAKAFGKDWDELMAWSVVIEDPKKTSPPLPWHINSLFPFIKSFF